MLIPEFDLGISTNENGTLTPFSLKTLEAQALIKLGEELDSAHYDRVTKRLLVNMAADKEVIGLLVLEVPSLKTLGVVRLSTKKPEDAQANGKGGLWMASRDEGMVYRIDMRESKVTARWPTPGCAQANGLAFDEVSQRIFLGCRGSAPVAALTTPGPVTKPSFALMNAQTGAILYTQEMAVGNDTGGGATDGKHKTQSSPLPISRPALLPPLSAGTTLDGPAAAQINCRLCGCTTGEAIATPIDKAKHASIHRTTERAWRRDCIVDITLLSLRC